MSTLCTACGFNNPPGMRFCGNCGARLSEVAPTHQDPISSPGDLGVMMGADLIERFRVAGLQAAGQRRNVTVLFVDLTDYTRLAEEIDSEDLYDIIQQFINLLVAAVYKFDGMVDKIVGDGLMALFGAPIGHENNAELALRSALEMQQGLAVFNQKVQGRLGHALQMHIGLHSGTVIVGGVGSNMLMDYTAIGDTVNLAHRLEETAGPGTMMVSESVFRQTRMLFDYEMVPALSLKGIQRKVTGYKLIGPKDRPGRVRGVEGLTSPMVGRDTELTQLKQAVMATISNQSGGFAMIFGEAGIGKSRLLAELRAQVRDEKVAIYEGQSLTYRRSVAYWIFLDLMRNYLGVSANAPEAQVRARLAELVEANIGDSAGDTIPYLEHLLSLKPSSPTAAVRINQLDADQLRQQIFIAVRDLFVAESQQRPVLLILDDLHWADDASLDLLNFLLTSIHSAPIYICGISRPVEGGLLTQVVAQAEKRLSTQYLLIQLKSLPQEKSEQLLYQLLTIPDLPLELREQIVQRAAGVPFYLEEILRMLIDDGIIYRDGIHWRLYPEADISSLGVPDNLRALILARFDRLDQQQRRILQVSAVIGREFSIAVVEAVLTSMSGAWIDDQLSQLVERGFIVPQLDSHQSDYAFRHVLTSDAIYSTLLRKDRADLHGRVGEATEALYADRLSEYIYLLARHYSWSPRLDRALHYLILAGQKSARDYINEQAREYFEQCIQLLSSVAHDDSQAFAVYKGLGDVLVFIGEYDHAREYYHLAEKFIDKDDLQQASVYVDLLRKLGTTFERQSDYDQVLEYLTQAQTYLTNCNADLSNEWARVWNDIGWIHFRRGNFEKASELFQRALELVVDTDSYSVIASIYNRLGGVAYMQGNWDEAAKYLRNSIAIREAIGDDAGLVSSTNNLGNLEIEMGRYDDALADLKRNFDLVKRLGQSDGISVAYNNLGWLYILRGELDEAYDSLNSALELANQIGFTSLIREVRKNFGELYLAREQWEQAQSVLLEVVPTFEKMGANDQLLTIYRFLGEAAVGKGDLDQAFQWSHKIDEITQQYGENMDGLPTLLRGELLCFKGMLAIQVQEYEQANRNLEQSLEIFRKLHSRLKIGRALHQIGCLAISKGNQQLASDSFSEAETIFREIGASLDACRAEEARLAIREA